MCLSRYRTLLGGAKRYHSDDISEASYTHSCRMLNTPKGETDNGRRSKNTKKKKRKRRIRKQLMIWNKSSQTREFRRRITGKRQERRRRSIAVLRSLALPVPDPRLPSLKSFEKKCCFVNLCSNFVKFSQKHKTNSRL